MTSDVNVLSRAASERLPAEVGWTGRPAKILLAVALVVAAGALAPEPRALVPVAAFVASLCFIFLFPRIGTVPNHVWGPALCAFALVLSESTVISYFEIDPSPVTFEAAAEEISSRWGVPALILCLAYLSISLDSSGFFNWCSLSILSFARGDGRRLLTTLFWGVSVITFFTSNDIVILTVTPILIHLGRNARIENLAPYLFAMFVAANTASMGLYIGNPTNVVIGLAAGLGFADHFARMLLPTVVATCTSFLLVSLIFRALSRRHRIPERYRVPSEAGRSGWTRHMTIKVSIFGACLLLLGVFANPEVLAAFSQGEKKSAMHRATLPLLVAISFVSALAAGLYDLYRDRRTRAGSTERGARARLRRIPFEIVPFFFSFCILLRGIEKAGITERAADAVADAFSVGPIVGSLSTAFYGIGLVNMANNIPASLFFERTWQGTTSFAGVGERLAQIDPAYADIFIENCLFASNFGANLTFMGALAGLMWWRIIRSASKSAPSVRTMTLGQFTAAGLLIVPIVTIVTSLAICLCRTAGG